MKRTVLALAFGLALAAAAISHAQTPGPDPIAENLFPPELVMRHASDIALEERQRNAIKEAIQKAQSRFVDLQFELQGEAERMARLLGARPIDEATVLAQADKVMNLEREVKKTHLSLLVRIKNQLSSSQQEKLSALRRK